MARFFFSSSSYPFVLTWWIIFSTISFFLFCFGSFCRNIFPTPPHFCLLVAGCREAWRIASSLNSASADVALRYEPRRTNVYMIIYRKSRDPRFDIVINPHRSRVRGKWIILYRYAKIESQPLGVFGDPVTRGRYSYYSKSAHPCNEPCNLSPFTYGTCPHFFDNDLVPARIFFFLFVSLTKISYITDRRVVIQSILLYGALTNIVTSYTASIFSRTSSNFPYTRIRQRNL